MKYFTLGEEKMRALDELVESMQGKPILVMYTYVHELERLQERYPEARSFKGSPDSRSTTEEGLVEAWNADEVPILLLQPSSGGHGLNLQGGSCSDVVWFTIPYDLELYIQANARVHRQGVKNAVIVHHLIATDTIDEQIMKVLEGKCNVQDALLEGLKNVSKE